MCVFNLSSFSSARASYVKWGIVCSGISDLGKNNSCVLGPMPIGRMM